MPVLPAFRTVDSRFAVKRNIESRAVRWVGHNCRLDEQVKRYNDHTAPGTQDPHQFTKQSGVRIPFKVFQRTGKGSGIGHSVGHRHGARVPADLAVVDSPRIHDVLRVGLRVIHSFDNFRQRRTFRSEIDKHSICIEPQKFGGDEVFQRLLREIAAIIVRIPKGILCPPKVFSEASSAQHKIRAGEARRFQPCPDFFEVGYRVWPRDPNVGIFVCK